MAILFAIFFHSYFGLSAQLTEHHFSTEVDDLFNQLENEISLVNSTPIKVAITSITYSKNISEQTKDYTLSQIVTMNKEQVKFQFFPCMECMSPRVRVDPNTQTIIVEQGITTYDDYTKLQNTFKTDHIANMNLSYDSEMLILNINIIDIKKIKTVWSKKLTYYTKRSDEVSEMDFYIRETFLVNSSFTNVIQLGIGENVFNKRSVGLNIDFAMPSIKVSSYFSFGPYFTIPVNKNRIVYKINFGLGYGVYNGGGNAVLPIDCVISFFPHVHAIIGIKKGFALMKKASTNGLATIMPLSVVMGFGVNF